MVLDTSSGGDRKCDDDKSSQCNRKHETNTDLTALITVIWSSLSSILNVVIGIFTTWVVPSSWASTWFKTRVTGCVKYDILSDQVARGWSVD